MFLNRHDAGKQLAKELLPYREEDMVVYGVVRGGLPIASVIATELNAPLEVIISRKIGHVLNREVGICVVTEDFMRICDEIGVCCVDASWLDSETRLAIHEIKRLTSLIRGNKPRLSAKNKIAVIVDDGVASGLTIKSTLHMINRDNPKKVIVATPVAPHYVVEDLQQLVDAVVVIRDEDEFLGSVSQYYATFPQINDDELMQYMRN